MKNTGKIDARPVYRHVPNCLGCGTGNPRGFGLRFTLSDGGVGASFATGKELEGPEGFVHGGAIALLIDEAAAVLVSSRSEAKLMTAKIEAVYKSPAAIGERLTVAARPIRPGKSFFLAGVEVRGEDSRLIAEGRAWFIRRPGS